MKPYVMCVEPQPQLKRCMHLTQFINELQAAAYKLHRQYDSVHEDILFETNIENDTIQFSLVYKRRMTDAELAKTVEQIATRRRQELEQKYADLLNHDEIQELLALRAKDKK